MDLALLSVVALVAVALLFDYTNGFHDSANSVSTVVATGALRPRLAVLWAAAFNFVAFAFFGTKVADTIGQPVEQGFVSIAVIFAALAGVILWNYATWWLGMPTGSWWSGSAGPCAPPTSSRSGRRGPRRSGGRSPADLTSPGPGWAAPPPAG
jgi:hypothetical protein